MTLIKYVKLNIANMIKNNKFIFSMIIASATLTSLCLFFSYGLFINTRETLGAMELDNVTYDYTIPEVTGLPEKIDALEKELGDDLDHIDLFIRVKDKNGSEIHCGAYSSFGSTGESEYSCKVSDAFTYLVEDNRLVLDGVSYKAEIKKADEIYLDAAVPLKSITDTAVGTEIMFYTKSQPTSDRVNEINLLLAELFGATSISTPQARSLMDNQINNTFYAYSFIIVIIVVINLCMYFRYTINVRKKQIRILIICGAEKAQVGIIYIIEALIELLIGYAFAYLIYDRLLLDQIIKYYPGFSDYYSSRLYLSTLVIYVLGSVLVLIISISPYISRLLSVNKAGDLK